MPPAGSRRILPASPRRGARERRAPPARRSRQGARLTDGVRLRIGSRRVLLRSLFLVSLCLRTAHLVAVYGTPPFSFHRDFVVSDMYLFDQWAQRIVDGDVLGREPYLPILDWISRIAPPEKWREWAGSAPAFYKAPLYAYLIASLRWLFGDAMLPLVVLQVLASSASAVLLFLIGERLLGKAGGYLGALLFAVYAPGIHYDVTMLRGPWVVLTSLLVTWQLIRCGGAPTFVSGCVLGASVGLAMLVNESFVTLAPLVLGLLAWQLRDLRRLARVGGGFALGLAFTLGPLVTRNVIVGAPPLQLAVTGAPVFACYNASGAEPYFFRSKCPPGFSSIMEESRGRFLGVLRLCLESFGGLPQILLFYLRRAVGLVVPFELADNANFYYAALRDPLLGVLPTYAVIFPLGATGLALALARRTPLGTLVPVTASLLASVMASLPTSRYRVPLIVFLMPLAGLALAQAYAWMCARRFARLGVLVAAWLVLFGGAGLLQQRVVFAAKDARLFTYRAVEFWRAAAFYEKQGRLEEASQELLQLAELNPDRAVRADALISAARDQGRAGNTGAARDSLRRASDLSSGNPSTLMVIGDAYWHELGDYGSARVTYGRALRLAGPGPLSDALRIRLERLQKPPLGGGS